MFIYSKPRLNENGADISHRDPIWERALATARRKLNEEWIKEDYAGFSYCTFTKAIELMNEAFGINGWHADVAYFEPAIGETKKGAKEFNFSGVVKIFLPDDVVLTGPGSCSAEWKQYNTGFKGAFADGFKKAMTQLGFFMELYPDSTDNPHWWADINEESGLFEILKDAMTKIEEDGSELVKAWSEEKWGYPAVYTTKGQTRYLFPDYLKDFTDWVVAKVPAKTAPKKTTKKKKDVEKTE